MKLKFKMERGTCREKNMKAVICTNYGAPDVLELKEIDKPEPKANEISVKVCATSVTVADFRIRSFTIPPSFWVLARLNLGLLRPRKPVLGMEVSGVVEAVGSGVTKFKAGDEIFASAAGHSFGAYAEYMCISQDGLVAHKPQNLSYEEAAVVPLGGRTALYFLRQAGSLTGKRVLVYGASGSVGSYAVQLAKHSGAHVTAVCSGKNAELARSLGADVVFDYTRPEFSLPKDEYDVFFEAVGKTSITDCLAAIRPGGVFLHSVSTPAVTFHAKLAARKKKIKFIGGGPGKNLDDLLLLKQLVEEGKVKPLIDRIYPLEEIRAAHEYVGLGHKRGNVVVKVR